MKTFFLLILLFIATRGYTQNEVCNIDPKERENLHLKIQNEEEFILPASVNSGLAFKASNKLKTDNNLQDRFPNISIYNIYSEGTLAHGTIIFTPNDFYYTFIDADGITIATSYIKDRQIITERSLDQVNKQKCVVERIKGLDFNPRNDNQNFFIGDLLRKFRLAVVSTGEYFEAFGNNDISESAAIASILQAVETMNLVFQRDLAISFDIVGYEIYQDPEEDPFTPIMSGDSDNRTLQSSASFNNSFTNDEYDIGLTFHAKAEGWDESSTAALGVVCATESDDDLPLKARGWVTANNSQLDFIMALSHQVGHMFGARHTHNSNDINCSDGISLEDTYEIGGGHTIMANPAGCGDQSYQDQIKEENLYFHSRSIYTIDQFLKNKTCQQEIETGAEMPVFDVNLNDLDGVFRVPLNTPFQIYAYATGSEEYRLYTWEQYDKVDTLVNSIGKIGEDAATSGNGPLFRNHGLIRDPEVRFPKTYIFDGSNEFDQLSKVPREINLRLTARSLNPEGGPIASNNYIIEVVDVGPFEIRLDPSIDSIKGGEIINISWTTEGMSEFCENVSIILKTVSEDFNYELAESYSLSEGNFTWSVPENFMQEGPLQIEISCIDDGSAIYNFSKTFEGTENCANPYGAVYSNNFNLNSTYQGDEDLNIDAEYYQAKFLHQIQDLEINHEDPLHALVLEGSNNDCTQYINSDGLTSEVRFKYFDFRTTSEFHSFFRIIDSGVVMTIYEADLFDPDDLCKSFVASNSLINSSNQLIVNSSLSLKLEKGKLYKLGISKPQVEIPYLISVVIGKEQYGQSYDFGSSPIASEDVLFVILGGDDKIIAIYEDSDFRDLPLGNYGIVQISTSEDYTQVDYVGKPISYLSLAGLCISRSAGNYITIHNEIPDEDNDGFLDNVDCDDLNANINPGAIEIIDNDVDEDCDGEVLYTDEDNDGFGVNIDCDDANPNINPSVDEIPNNDIDEDCDGEALYVDEDMDGFNSDEDCDDSNPNINPDAIEIPNNVDDENCNGEIGIIDMDGDGFNSAQDCDDLNPNINPIAQEIANNGIDEDCNGEDLISTSTLDLDLEVNIFPNPTSSIINVKLKVPAIRISLYSYQGQLLKVDRNNTNFIEFDLSELASGMYFLKIEHKNQKSFTIEKIVKL